MRIELPSLSWADTHRAQDDAHTLTLPSQRPVPALEAFEALLPGIAADDVTVRVEVAAVARAPLTLTL